MVSMISASNKAYDITESRPWWKVRLTAVGVTLALSFLIVIAFTLIIFGVQLGDAVASHFGLGALFVGVWKIIQWPVAFALVVGGIGLTYYFALDAEQDWVWVTPGSLVATILWLVGSLGFRFYAVNFGSFEATYGAIGGVILLLLWFYLTGLAIVIGPEMNAEIERESPWANTSRGDVAGEKKKIGAAAARTHRDKTSPLPPRG